MNDVMQGSWWLLLAISAAVVLLVHKVYLPKYFEKKAENLATREDIAAITTEVERVKTKYGAELEHLKADLLRLGVVHRTAFEAEFQAFRAVWEKLALVRGKLSTAQPFRFQHPADNDLAVFEKDWANFVLAKNDFVRTLDASSPYLWEEIFERLEEIVTTLNEEYGAVSTAVPEQARAVPGRVERFNRVCEQTANVSALWRKRLDELRGAART